MQKTPHKTSISTEAKISISQDTNHRQGNKNLGLAGRDVGQGIPKNIPTSYFFDNRGLLPEIAPLIIHRCIHRIFDHTDEQLIELRLVNQYCKSLVELCIREYINFISIKFSFLSCKGGDSFPSCFLDDCCFKALVLYFYAPKNSEHYESSIYRKLFDNGIKEWVQALTDYRLEGKRKYQICEYDDIEKVSYFYILVIKALEGAATSLTLFLLTSLLRKNKDLPPKFLKKLIPLAIESLKSDNFNVKYQATQFWEALVSKKVIISQDILELVAPLAVENLDPDEWWLVGQYVLKLLRCLEEQGITIAQDVVETVLSLTHRDKGHDRLLLRELMPFAIEALKSREYRLQNEALWVTRIFINRAMDIPQELIEKVLIPLAIERLKNDDPQVQNNTLQLWEAFVRNGTIVFQNFPEAQALLMFLIIKRLISDNVQGQINAEKLLRTLKNNNVIFLHHLES